jgi:flagellar hook assembly protein FlgD
MAEQPLPTQVELQQNFPNPFNPSTTITFAVSGAQGPVELEVFDLLGRRVRSLAVDRVPAGSHSVLWAGDDDSGHRVGTGVYLYRLRANGVERTRKMMLVE